MQKVTTKIKSPSDLKYWHKQNFPDSHFFDRDTMRYWGDTIKNYGMRHIANDTIIRLYRKYPVKEALQGNAYFCALTAKLLHDYKE